MKYYTERYLSKIIGFSLMLIVILNIASALTYVGQDDEGYMVLSGSTATVRINPGDNSMYINNMIKLLLFPHVTIGGKSVPATTPKYTQPLIGAKLTTFEVDYPEGFSSDVYVGSKVEITDKKITQTIKIENTKDSEAVVKIKLSMDNNTLVEYAPFLKDRSKNYVVMSPSKRGIYGRILVVYFDPNPPSFIPAAQIATVKSSDQLVWLVRVPGKSKYVLHLTYLSGYLAQSGALANLPVKSSVDKEPYLLVETDPLLVFYHQNDFSKLMPQLDLTKPGLTILSQIEKYVNGLPNSTAEFGLTSYIDWDILANSQAYNSLEKAVIFREICRQVGIPARLHIGKKREGNYYAWVTAYVGNLEETYDPFKKMSDYPEVYAEPSPYLCKDNIESCVFENVIKVGVVCIGPICINVILIAAVIVVVLMGGLGLIMYKSDVIMKMLTQTTRRDVKVDGNYTILEEPKNLDDPLLKEVFDYIKANNGVVDIVQMSHTLGYSKILIISAIERLAEDGVIARE